MIDARRRWLAIAAVVSLGAIAAAIVLFAGGGPGTASATPQRQQIVVTRGADGDMRPTCTPRSVGRRLRGFSDALAEVDATALRRYWGRGFRWFGVALNPVKPGRSGFEVYRSQREPMLRGYREGVAKLRRRGGLRLRFREVVLNDHIGDGQFDAVWQRRAGRAPVDGKFKLSCGRPTIVAMAAGSHKPGHHQSPHCPRAHPPPQRGAMVVCTSRNLYEG